jgi:nuclear cap-binding protein subunit 1
LLRSLAVATLERGQKCITHHDVLLKRYALPIRDLVDKAGAEVLVDAAAGVWRGHPQMAPIAIERLLALELVTPAAVVNWLLQRAAAFGEDDTYEIANVVCEFVCASKEQAIGKREALLQKLREAEAEAAAAGQAATDLTEQGRVFEAQQAQAAEASAVEEITIHETALASADAPVERCTAVTREICLNLCGGLVKAASGGASAAVADRVLAFVRAYRAELALDADALIKAAGSKKTAKSAVAAALGVPLK